MEDQENKTEDITIVLTEQESTQQAYFIEMLKPWIVVMNLPYLKECVKAMRADASWQDSASVLSRNYDPAVTQLMRKQAEALQNLIDYIEALQECEKMKGAISKNGNLRDSIEKLFYKP